MFHPWAQHLISEWTLLRSKSSFQAFETFNHLSPTNHSPWIALLPFTMVLNWNLAHNLYIIITEYLWFWCCVLWYRLHLKSIFPLLAELDFFKHVRLYIFQINSGITGYSLLWVSLSVITIATFHSRDAPVIKWCHICVLTLLPVLQEDPAPERTRSVRGLQQSMDTFTCPRGTCSVLRSNRGRNGASSSWRSCRRESWFPWWAKLLTPTRIRCVLGSRRKTRFSCISGWCI